MQTSIGHQDVAKSLTDKIVKLFGPSFKFDFSKINNIEAYRRISLLAKQIAKVTHSCYQERLNSVNNCGNDIYKAKPEELAMLFYWEAHSNRFNCAIHDCNHSKLKLNRDISNLHLLHFRDKPTCRFSMSYSLLTKIKQDTESGILIDDAILKRNFEEILACLKINLSVERRAYIEWKFDKIFIETNKPYNLFITSDRIFFYLARRTLADNLTFGQDIINREIFRILFDRTYLPILNTEPNSDFLDYYTARLKQNSKLFKNPGFTQFIEDLISKHFKLLNSVIMHPFAESKESNFFTFLNTIINKDNKNYKFLKNDLRKSAKKFPYLGTLFEVACCKKSTEEILSADIMILAAVILMDRCRWNWREFANKFLASEEHILYSIEVIHSCLLYWIDSPNLCYTQNQQNKSIFDPDALLRLSNQNKILRFIKDMQDDHQKIKKALKLDPNTNLIDTQTEQATHNQKSTLF